MTLIVKPFFDKFKNLKKIEFDFYSIRNLNKMNKMQPLTAKIYNDVTEYLKNPMYVECMEYKENIMIEDAKAYFIQNYVIWAPEKNMFYKQFIFEGESILTEQFYEYLQYRVIQNVYTEHGEGWMEDLFIEDLQATLTNFSQSILDTMLDDNLKLKN